MSAALQQSAPAELGTLYRAAHARMMRLPDGFSFQGCPYRPLAELVHQAEHFGGAVRVAALSACQEVIDADDATLARMVRDQRPSPSSLTGFQATQARLEQHRLGIEQLSAITRPRVTLAEQLSAMEARGIGITVEGRHLKVHAAPGVVTEADRNLLREHKAEIIGWINTNEETF